MDYIQIIGTSTQELLSFLKIKAQVEVFEDEEESEKQTYNVEISGDDLGVLIGYHGETLNHLQQILSLIINKKTEEWIRIVIDVNGWREQRKQAVINLAQQAIARVRQSGQAQVLPPMNAYERRIIHTVVSEEQDLQTHSEGEALSRKVIIEIKK